MAMATLDLITAHHLAKLMHCSVKTVWEHTRNGAFPPDSVVLIGGRKLYDAEAIFAAGRERYNRRLRFSVQRTRRAS
jgi:hypothetical protein